LIFLRSVKILLDSFLLPRDAGIEADAAENGSLKAQKMRRSGVAAHGLKTPEFRSLLLWKYQKKCSFFHFFSTIRHN